MRRLIYIDVEETQRINPLFYPFIIATFLYGFGFSLFNWWSGINKSSLYQAMYSTAASMPVIWGSMAALASIFAIILALYRRGGLLGEVAAMFVFLVWLYAAWIYGEGGYWLVMLSVAGPNTYFWAWYYTRVKWWEREKVAGRLIDAGS